MMQAHSGGKWDTYSTEIKQQLLVEASFAVDSAMAYKGERPEGQTLKFPRDGVLPIQVKLATMQIVADFSDSEQSGDVKRETISKFTTEYFSGSERARNSAELVKKRYLEPYRLREIAIHGYG